MNRYLLLLAVLLCALPLRAEQCNGDPLWLYFEVQAPLMAQYGPALRLRVHHKGCLQADFPSWRTPSGRHVRHLSEPALAALHAEIAGSGITEIDAQSLRQRLRAATERDVHHVVADGNLVRVEIHQPDGRSAFRVYWPNLDEDLLNHPQQSELHVLAAVRDRLWELSLSADREPQP